MEIIQNNKKQIIISSIYATVALAVVFWIYSCVKPVPNCFDGKFNQNEKRTDCGGVCAKKCELIAQEDIKIIRTGLVESGLVNKYDIYAEIENPNNLLGSSEFQYDFKVKSASGQVVAQKSGIEFILPSERKYIIALNIETSDKPNQAEFNISNVKWTEFGSYQKPDLEVVNKIYNEITNGVGFGEARGLVKNKSEFDFATINVGVILKDEDGKVLALNATAMNTIKSGENRDFRAYWPTKFFGNVADVEIQPDVNVFKSETFLKRYFTPGQFQSY